MNGGRSRQNSIALTPNRGGPGASEVVGGGLLAVIAVVTLATLLGVAFSGAAPRLMRRIKLFFRVVVQLIEGFITLVTGLCLLMLLTFFAVAVVIDGLRRVLRWCARHPFLTVVLGLTASTVAVGVLSVLIAAGVVSGVASWAASLFLTGTAAVVGMGHAAWASVLGGVVAMSTWVVRMPSALGKGFWSHVNREASPGMWMGAFADFFCTRRTMREVVEPLLADLRYEYAEARSQGRTWKARWLRICYLGHFAKTLGPASLWAWIVKLVEVAVSRAP